MALLGPNEASEFVEKLKVCCGLLRYRSSKQGFVQKLRERSPAFHGNFIGGHHFLNNEIFGHTIVEHVWTKPQAVLSLTKGSSTEMGTELTNMGERKINMVMFYYHGEKCKKQVIDIIKPRDLQINDVASQAAMKLGRSCRLAG